MAWLPAAARALVYIGAVYIVEQVLRAVVAGFAPTSGPAALAAYTAATLVAALGVGAVLLRWFDQRGPAALGIALGRHVPREAGIGLLAGVTPQLIIALLLFGIGGLSYAADTGSSSDWLGSLGAAFAVLTIAAAAEEAVYRGYGFQVLVRGFGVWPTLLITSGFFALAHGRNPAVTPFALLNIFLAGVVLGLAYLRTLSLWLVTAVHVGWNWSMASLLDLPVSGLTMFDTPLYEPIARAPAWLGGGSFGPEGGLLGSAGLVLALLLVWRWPGLRPAPAQLAARPLPLRISEEGMTHE